MATAACNEAGPAKETTYKSKGKTVTASGLPVYVTGTGKHAIILIYDIMGWGGNKNLFELSDRFAEAGFTVVMSDHFRGNPWPLNKLPFKDDKERQEFFDWLAKTATPALVVKDVEEIIIPLLEKELKCTHFNTIGFCWGGRATFDVAQNPKILGIATIHGLRVTEEVIKNIKCPVYYGPTPQDPPSVEVVKKILDEKDFGKKCVYHLFEKMEHGFCGSRGDWTKPETKKNVDLVFEQFVAFCKETIKS